MTCRLYWIDYFSKLGLCFYPLYGSKSSIKELIVVISIIWVDKLSTLLSDIMFNAVCHEYHGNCMFVWYFFIRPLIQLYIQIYFLNYKL